MHAYQQACGGVIERYAGHVAQYLGDGLVVYFGFPQAHEDDAERAVRAALDIVAAVNQLSGTEPMQVRIGIATGPVVVGETGAGDASVPSAAVGETPNLAARLRALAGADQIVIAPSTHRLLGNTFDIEDLGDHLLKGIDGPVRARRIRGLADSESRFDAIPASAGDRRRPGASTRPSWASPFHPVKCSAPGRSSRRNSELHPDRG